MWFLLDPAAGKGVDCFSSFLFVTGRLAWLMVGWFGIAWDNLAVLDVVRKPRSRCTCRSRSRCRDGACAS